MSFLKKYLKILLFLNLLMISASKANDGLKINTDLTAGIISSSVNSASSNINNKNYVDSLNNLSHNNSVSGVAFSNNNLEDNHICTKEEEYIEEKRTPSIQPVKIRTATWCLEFPPRCSNYKTEMREVVKIQNITKTRTIRFCCAGYEGNISINDTVCKPVCRGGCGRGYCLKPDVCSCEPGYMGKHCTQRCDHDHWGLECKNQCQCHNGAACDNKSGICHCTIGWRGEFCEQPCPMGTHGVMCRKACECNNKLCHPQTGACDHPTIPPNATHVMIATLNSTIVNITHNLDRIAKNIGTIATTTDNVKYALPPQLLDLTSAKPIPEVIVIKQDEPPHTPKIIVHQPGQGLLENLHGSGKTPEVIHVITNWPAGVQPHHNATQDDKINLAGFGGTGSKDKEESSKSTESHNTDHENGLLTILLLILLVIMVAIGIGFLYVYRRYHLQKAQVEAALAARSVSLVPGISAPIVITPPPLPPHTNDQHLKEMTGGGLIGGAGTLNKSFLKPLPDLPAFTQMVRNKIEGPDLYDSPSNTSSLTSQTPTPTPYAYARKESLYSIVTPKSRKGSMDSHLYDEIRYPTALHQQTHIGSHNVYPQRGSSPLQHQHQHHQQQQQNQLQHQQLLHQQQQQQQQQQHHHHHQNHAHNHHHQPHSPNHTSATTHHISHLVIPPQNSKYLQVPQISHASHKIAHI